MTCPETNKDIQDFINSSQIPEDTDIYGLGLVGYTKKYFNIKYDSINQVSTKCGPKESDSCPADTPQCTLPKINTGIYSDSSMNYDAKLWNDGTRLVCQTAGAKYPCQLYYRDNIQTCPKTNNLFCHGNKLMINQDYCGKQSGEIKTIWCGDASLEDDDNKICNVFSGNPTGLQVCTQKNDKSIYNIFSNFVKDNYEKTPIGFNYFNQDTITDYKNSLISSTSISNPPDNLNDALVLPEIIMENNEYYLSFPMLVMNIDETEKDYLGLMKKYISNFLGEQKISDTDVFNYLDPYQNSKTDFCCQYNNNTNYICIEWMIMNKTYNPGKQKIGTYTSTTPVDNELQTITQYIMESKEPTIDFQNIEYITITYSDTKIPTFSFFGGKVAGTIRPPNSDMYVPKFERDYLNSLEPKYSDYSYEYLTDIGEKSYGDPLTIIQPDNKKINTVNDMEILASESNFYIYDKYDSNANNKIHTYQYVHNKNYIYTAVVNSTGQAGTTIGKLYNVDDSAQKTPNFLLGNSTDCIFIDTNMCYNTQSSGRTQNMNTLLNNNKFQYTAGQLRENFRIIGKWYKFRINKWSPTLYIMAAIKYGSSISNNNKLLEKVYNDVDQELYPIDLFYNTCTKTQDLWDKNASSCNEHSQTECNKINLGIDETSYKLPGIRYFFDNYFLVSSSYIQKAAGVCRCISSSLKPAIAQSTPTIEDAAHCFSSSCLDTKLSGIKKSDDFCKSKCGLVYDWLTNKNPGKKSQLPQELNNEKYLRLCKDYIPPQTLNYNKPTLFIGILLVGITVAVLLKIFKNKSTKFKIILNVFTGIILLGFVIFLSFDLKGISSCNDNKSVCKSRITGITIPKSLCSEIFGCECTTGVNATCSSSNQECIGGFCKDFPYPQNITNGKMILPIGETFKSGDTFTTPDKKYTLSWEKNGTFGIYYTDTKKYKWSINKSPYQTLIPQSSTFENGVLKFICKINNTPSSEIFKQTVKKVTPDKASIECSSDNPDYTNFSLATKDNIDNSNIISKKLGYKLYVPEADSWWGSASFTLFPASDSKYDSYSGQYGYYKEPNTYSIANYPSTLKPPFEQNAMCFNTDKPYDNKTDDYIWSISDQIPNINTDNTFIVLTNDGNLAGYNITGQKIWESGSNNKINMK